MNTYKKLIAVFTIILSTLSANCQTDVEFWFAVPELTWRHVADQKTYLHIASLDAPADVVVEMPRNAYDAVSNPKGFNPILVTLPANGYNLIDLTSIITASQDDNILEVGLDKNAGTVENNGLHIKSTALITAYLERADNDNTDLWALKGRNAIGKNFIVPSQNTFYNKAFGTPAAWNSIDVVAVEDATVTFTVPKGSAVKVNGTVKNFTSAPGTVSQKLKAGQAFSLRSAAVGTTYSGFECDRHLGGTIIKSTGNIVVQWKDDSMKSDYTGSYDVAGDQIVPTDLAGFEYVVMRGQLGNGNKNSEYVYIMATEPNTTVTFTTEDGSHTVHNHQADIIKTSDSDRGVSYKVNYMKANSKTIDYTEDAPMVLSKVGEIKYVRLNELSLKSESAFSGDAANLKNYDALHIKADKKIIVFHISGFGSEMGGAILPTIDGCTGSSEVSFMRSSVHGFYLNIMCKGPFIDYFTIEIEGREYPIPGSWFKKIEGSGTNESSTWYYLNKSYNEFGKAQGGIPAIQVGKTVKVKNKVGLFHLGIINGNASGGCRYGYFSDFSDNQSRANIANSGSDYHDFCEGDTITLQASGGVEYKWKYIESGSSIFIDPDTESTPRVKPTPGFNHYEVTIRRACYTGNQNQDTTVDVYAFGIPQIVADFDISPSTVCSPRTVTFTNNTTGANTFYWTIDGQPISEESEIVLYPFINQGGTAAEYHIVSLKASLGNGCPNSKSKTVTVCPSSEAKVTADVAIGCQPLTVTFTDESTGNISRTIWNFGDGTGDKDYAPGTIAKHTYVNPSETDTIYYAKVVTTNTFNCSDTAIVPITVHGMVKAQFTIDKASGCAPFDVNFKNYSIGYGPKTVYTWNIGGDYTGTPSSTKNAEFTLTYNNETQVLKQYKDITLTATLTANNGDVCISTSQRDTITVYPHFTIDYEVSPISGCNPLEATFTNQSNIQDSKTQFKWYFGDGSSANNTGTFSHTYAHAEPTQQHFQTALAGESQYGCRDSVAKDIITVEAYLAPHFTIDNSEGCSPVTINLTNNTPAHAKSDNSTWTFTNTSGANYPYTLVSGSLSNTAKLRFENKTGTIQVITIRLTESIDGTRCSESYEQKITIYPEVSASFVASQPTVCDSTQIVFTNNSIFTGTTLKPSKYSWIFGNGATKDMTSASAVSQLYRNTSGSTGTTAQNYTVTLIASANGCADTATTQVAVYPPVKASFVAEDGKYNVCAPATIKLKNTSTGANQYLWEYNDGTPSNSTYNLANVNYPVPSTTTPNTVDVKIVTMTASNGSCTSTAKRTFNVSPEIKPSLTVSKSAGCGPLDVTLSSAGTTGNSLSYAWNFGDNSPILNQTTESVNHTFGNDSGNDKTYTAKLTVTNNLGCKATVQANVTVYPEIDAQFSIIKTTECSPMDVDLVNNSQNGNKYIWTFGDGQTETSTSARGTKHQYKNTSPSGNDISTYTIKLITIDANHTACRDSIKHDITVYPEVIAAFDATNTEGCSPLTSSFTNKSKGYGLSYVWQYDYDNTSSTTTDATHNHTFDNREATTRTYNVKLIATDFNKCTSTATKTVKAYPHVIAGFGYVKEGVCTPYEVSFNQPNNAINGTKFSWDFGDGSKEDKSTKATFKHTYDNTTANTVNTYNIKLLTTDTNTGCKDSTTQTIEVYPRLIPAFEADVTEGCNPVSVSFTNKTTGLATYAWTFGDGQSSTLTNPAHTFTNYNTTDETYTTTLTTTQSATGCQKTTSKDITAYSFVLAKFGINGADLEQVGSQAGELMGGCTPFKVVITDSSRINANTGSWSWNFGDGTTSNNRQPSILTYTNNDSVAPLENKRYDISLRVTNNHGCYHDTVQSLTVYPRSVPNFTGDFEGCMPHTVTFEDKSVIDDGTKYFWSFGDGSTAVTAPPFSKTYNNYSNTNDQVFTINLKTTTQYNCTDEISKTVTVHPKPQASFSPLIDRACPPFNAEFKNNSIGTNLTYHWDFDNGETIDTRSRSNQHSEYSNDTNEPITKYVELIAESPFGCLDTMVNPMITFPNVIVDFEVDSIGCSPLNIQVTNKSTQTATIHHWEFGDGSTSVAAEPAYTYYNTSNNDVQYTITYIGTSKYQCVDTVKHNVIVYINPTVDFVADAPSQRYPDDTVIFQNYTQDGPWTYKWDFGDGNTSTTGEREFLYKYGRWAPNDSNNIFHVTLTVGSEHCSNTISHDVTVLPPYPNIVISNVKPAGCVPLTVDFRVEEEYTTSYLWEFEDGTTSTEMQPTHEFTEPGLYNVKLTAFGDGGSHYDYEIITVYELPEPKFTAAPTFVMLPDQPVQFFNQTLNGNTYIWDFGDGTYSTEQNPTHQYKEEGMYDVKLIAFSNQMCTDSIIEEQHIEVSGEGYIRYPNAFIPSSSSPTNGSYPEPDDINNVFHPISFGVKEYELWVYNRWGEELFHSTDITIGWNGRYSNSGKELGQDVYFWKAKGTFQNNTPFKIAGDVTLIRKKE